MVGRLIKRIVKSEIRVGDTSPISLLEGLCKVG